MPDFSTPAEHAFEAQDPDPSNPEEATLSTSTSTLSLADRYSITSTLEHILSNDGYKTIALQFPDELLPNSVLVYRMLMKGIKEHARKTNTEGVERQCYVLGDSTYGSCCPDVLSALHLPADLLVHYGHACLTRTEALPVLYVFPKRDLDCNNVAEQLYQVAFDSEESAENVVVMWDVAYDWIKDDIIRSFNTHSSKPQQIKNLIFSKINSQVSPTASSSRIPNYCSSSGSGTCCNSSSNPTQSQGCCGSSQSEKGKEKACGCEPVVSGVKGKLQQLGLQNVDGAQEDISEHDLTKPVNGNETDPNEKGERFSLREFEFPEGVGMKDCIVFYIGEESRGVVNLMMENSQNKIYQFDPSSESTSALHVRTPRLLQKRLLALHKMYQTSTIGILVHNVGLRSSHTMVKHLRALIRSKGRKSYTISVGRVRPEKLANFEAVGGWVLVGCREGGLIDGKEYYRPVVTPHELRLALQGEMESWKPEEWTLDMASVLRDIERDRVTSNQDDGEGNGEEEDDDRPIFSLADGSYHMTRRFGGKKDEEETRDLGAEGALIKREEGGALVKRSEQSQVAAVHLASRAFQGLDASEGYDAHGNLAPSKLVDGRVGVARGYRVDNLGKEGQ